GSWKPSFASFLLLSALSLIPALRPALAQGQGTVKPGIPTGQSAPAGDSTAALGPAIKAPHERPKAPGPALWIDFEKNEARLTSPQAIQAVVDSAWSAGFTRLIVDVKKMDGSVAFKSRRAPSINLPFDYFGAFRKAAEAHGMETI